MKARADQSRVGSALMGTLLVITVAAMSALAILSAGGATAGASARTGERVRTRALAWSAVQAVVSALASQRDALFSGEDPQIADEIELWRDGRDTAIARLVPIDSPRSDFVESGVPKIQPESGKLDINYASVEMLTALGVCDASTAEEIVSRRASRAWSSIEELATLPGMPLTALYGGRAPDGATPRQPTSRNSPAPSASGTVPAVVPTTESGAPAISRLTTFSFDPAVIAGVGAAADLAGEARGDARTPWSEEEGRLAESLLGPEIAASFKRIKESKLTLDSDHALVGAMRTLGVPREHWGVLLDVLNTTDDLYLPGRVDLNRAGEEVLATIPGFDAEIARLIVRGREGLGADQRLGVTWPLDLDLVDEAQFESAVDWLCVRTSQWRVRIEAGVRREDVQEGESSLRGRVVIDAIIDLADARPRVAYMREITHLGVALAMEREVSAAASELEQKSRDALPTPPGVPPPDTTIDLQPPEMDASVDLPPDLNLRTMDGPDASESPAPVETPSPRGSTMRDRRTGRWTPGGSS